MDKDKLTFKIVEIELIPKAEQKFNIQLDPSFKLIWGECDNYAYRTYFDVEDELTGDKLQDIFVYTKDVINGNPKYSEDRTNRGGRAVLYLKPNESFKIGFRDNNYIHKDEDKYITVTEPDEKITVKMIVDGPPTYIEPRPAETEEVPAFFLGENLRYHTLYVAYETDKGKREFYIPFTDEMVKQFDPNTLGEQTLVIEYNGKSWSHKIKIIEDNRELQSVFLSPVPTKKEYKTGESLDLGSAKLNAVYKNVNTGETETDKNIDITSDMISGFDTSTEGEKEVTVTFTDAKGRTASTSFNITVVEENRTVESIKIKTPPNKIEYAVGEALDITGLTIDVNFTDGTSSTGVSVSSGNVTGFDSDTPGIQILTVTYTDKYGNEASASFKVKVGSGDEVTGIEIQQLVIQNKYCQINGSLNLENAFIKVTYADGTSDSVQITEDMISGFDSSTLGTFPVTVTYKQCQTSYEVKVVENLHIVYEMKFSSERHENIWRDTTHTRIYSYVIYFYYLDGSKQPWSWNVTYDSTDPENDSYEGATILRNAPNGDDGKIKITNFDITQNGVQEVKVTYCNADGTPDPDVKPISEWVAIHSGDYERDYYGTHNINPSLGEITDPISVQEIPGYEGDLIFRIGERIPLDKYFMYYYTWVSSCNKSHKESTKTPHWCEPSLYLRGSNGFIIKDDKGNDLISPKYLLSSCNYLGGFDSSYPTRAGEKRCAYFECKGFVLTIHYEVVSDTEAAMSLSEDYDSYYEEETPVETEEIPAETEVTTVETEETPAETEAPDNTNETDSTEPTETEITESTVTEPHPEETTVTETASAEETPVFGNDSSGVFGFGRSGRKTAQYANLHKNDIYNYYVVRSASADILGRDNLLFVGQTSSDGMGSLSFEYETTTGEDGTVILKPMSDDPTTPDKPTTPDTPSDPTTPGNGGSSSNTAVIPVNGTVTKTMTIKVENKVTGETSKARGQKTGSSVTVKLGTENDGCYANVYTTDDEYICSAIIENGRAKFNVSNDVKLKIVIDSFAYGEDVSSEAGVFGDSAAENLPYAAITIVIAIVGIYFKRRSEKKVK